MIHLSDYDFELPTHLIATRPPKERRQARLLSLLAQDQFPRHGHFPDVLDFLQPGDALVLNNTKVFKARLEGHKASTGGKVELLLTRPLANGHWLCLAKTKKGLKAGESVLLQDAQAKVIGPCLDEDMAYEIAIEGNIQALTHTQGKLPLPPYFAREADGEDEQRYQTVFANTDKALAVAAPTAGLHFDEDLLAAIKEKGVHIVYVTLHVGPGTFLPIRDDDVSKHRMHAEYFEISQESANTLNAVRKAQKRIIAVGTTSIRTLESALSDKDFFEAQAGDTRIFIKPGFHFKVIDAFITNFHFPKTTLLLLVAAAIGKDRLQLCYQEAIKQAYRFFSYGDACYFEVKRLSSP